MNQAGKDQAAALENINQREKLAKVRASMEAASIKRQRRAQAHNN